MAQERWGEDVVHRSRESVREPTFPLRSLYLMDYNVLELLKMPLVTIDGFGQCIASKRHGGRYGQVVGARRTVGIG